MARTGVRFYSAGQVRCIRAPFAGFVAGEKAFTEIYNVNGASGTKPCINCKNTVGRNVTLEDGERYLRTIATGSAAQLDLRTDDTDDSIFEM